MIVTVLGTLGGVLTAIRLFPQLYKSQKTKETRDLSFLFLIILFFQSIFMIAYGWLKPDFFIFWMNIPPLICAIWLMKLKLKYK